MFPEEVRPCLTKYWKYKTVNPNRTVSLSVFSLFSPMDGHLLKKIILFHMLPYEFFI